jgi:hypothetical protein
MSRRHGGAARRSRDRILGAAVVLGQQLDQPAGAQVVDDVELGQPRIRVFLDFLDAAFSHEPPPWRRSAEERLAPRG